MVHLLRMIEAVFIWHGDFPVRKVAKSCFVTGSPAGFVWWDHDSPGCQQGWKGLSIVSKPCSFSVSLEIHPEKTSVKLIQYVFDQTDLIGGLEHFLFSIIYAIIMDNPSHWLIFFKMVIAPPTRDSLTDAVQWNQCSKMTGQYTGLGALCAC